MLKHRNKHSVESDISDSDLIQCTADMKTERESSGGWR